MFTPTGSFANVEAKIDRAAEHMDTLKAEIRSWAEGDPVSLRSEPERAAFQHRVYIRFRVKPDATRWGLLLGDAAHNLRSALDHLIYALAVRETRADPPPLWDKLEFPILDDPADWNPQHRSMTGLSDDMRTFIKLVQPFEVNTSKPSHDRLSTLRELDNSDKHRAIRPVGLAAQAVSLPVRMVEAGIAPTATFPDVALDQDEALLVSLSGVSKTEMDGYGELGMSLAINDEANPGALLHLEGLLGELLERVVGVVRDGQERFFSDTL